MQKSILSAAKFLTAMIAVALAPHAFGTANYVYHERTLNDVTGGALGSCVSAQSYVPTLNPPAAAAYVLRFKVEYQFFTDSLRVYYTTDGSTPSGSKGVASGTASVAVGAYQCTFGTPVVDVCNASIPAQPAGTVVKYIIGAWHSGGGDEIFANSGTCLGCGNFNDSSLATVFQYTVGGTTWTGRGTGILFSDGNNWDSGLPSAVPSVAIVHGSVTTKRTLDLATTSRNCTGTRFDLSSGADGFTFNASTPPGGYQIRAGCVPSGILNNDDSAQTFNVPMKIFTSGGGSDSG